MSAGNWPLAHRDPANALGGNSPHGLSGGASPNARGQSDDVGIVQQDPDDPWLVGRHLVLGLPVLEGELGAARERTCSTPRMSTSTTNVIGSPAETLTRAPVGVTAPFSIVTSIRRRAGFVAAEADPLSARAEDLVVDPFASASTGRRHGTVNIGEGTVDIRADYHLRSAR